MVYRTDFEILGNESLNTELLTGDFVESPDPLEQEHHLTLVCFPDPLHHEHLHVLLQSFCTTIAALCCHL